MTSSIDTGVDTVTFLLDQMEQGNIGLSSISMTQNIRGAKQDISSMAKTGVLGGKAVKIVTLNGLTLASDKLSIMGNSSALSYMQTSAKAETFAIVTGIGGAVVALVNDGIALYQRGCELHQIKKELDIAKKERPDSLTCRFLERKRDFQRWLVASSVVGVVADGASLAGALYATAGLGATVGSTAVTAVRMMGEDHLNDNFKKDLMKLAAEFTEKNPHVESDPHFEETYQALKEKYENAKTAHAKAEKDLADITKKIASQKGAIPADDLEQQERNLQELETAAAALKKVESGYKHMQEIHEDFQSYKACKALIKDLDALFEMRDGLKSKIAAFEEGYKKEFGDSFEPYKTRHFGEINPAWQKRYDALEMRLQARQQDNKLELRQVEESHRLAQNDLREIRDEIRSLKATLSYNDGSLHGYPRNERVYQNTIQKIKILQKREYEAWSKFDVEDKHVRAIRKNIEKTKEDQKALKQYAKNWKNLSEAREKIMVKNRGLENEQAILSADKMLKDQLPTQTLLSERNRLKLEQHKALHKLEKDEEPIVENEELDIVRHGTVEKPVSFVEKHEVPHSTLKDHHPTRIITKFTEAEQLLKPVTPTAKDDLSPSEPDYSELEDLFRTKTPTSPLSPPTFSVKTESVDSPTLQTKKVLVEPTKKSETSSFLTTSELVTA